MTSQFIPRLRMLQPTALAARIRQSLFAVPLLCLLLGIALAELTIRLDRSNVGSWLPESYESSAENARTVLGAIATGTITVVTLVLTLTLVAIQLASGQLSPRTIMNFLGDRFQQATVGIVLGTATFSVFALRALRVTAGDEGPQPPDLTVLTGVLLTVVSLAMLVISVDRTANRIAVGTLVNDIASETCALVHSTFEEGRTTAMTPDLPGRVAPRPHDAEWESRSVISADRSGWVQHIDEDELLAACPEGSSVRLLHPVGTFVLGQMVLVEIDAEVDDQAATAIRRAIVVGDHRTMQQDISFGITRLNDVALRALSPGINDPNTAREVALRIGQVVLALQEHVLTEVEDNVAGRSITRVGLPTHADYIRSAFDPIRDAAEGQRSVLMTLGRTLAVLEAETKRRSLPGSVHELQRQAQLVQRALAALPEGTPTNDDEFGLGVMRMP